MGENLIIITMLIALCVIGIGQLFHYFYVKRNYLLLNVYLDSRKEFNNFLPDSYLRGIGKKTFEDIEGALIANKKYLRITWRYTSPAGNINLHNSMRYNREYIESFVQEHKKIFDEGREKILGLNRQYEELLSWGSDADDKIPKIYCYSIKDSDDHKGLVKVGYSSNKAIARVNQQVKTAAHIKVDYEILFIMPALTIAGGTFKDHDVHKELKKLGVKNRMGEWFACSEVEAREVVMRLQGL